MIDENANKVKQAQWMPLSNEHLHVDLKAEYEMPEGEK